ncbi:MAG: T9SS type A sorting domain-containing protein, partial [Bacteroidota bacterium]|nr:T9SS type A sorting domain-containing protein [Bacteroidota bacterium]
TTISEINNYGFYVERRAESEEQFTEIPNSFVQGAGTTLEPQYYSFIDNTITENGLYHYRLRQVDNDGLTHYSQPVSINVTALSVRELAPIEFRVHQNYPNPFNPTTTIKFSVEKVEHAAVVVYNVLGQEVARLFDGIAEPGYYYKVQLNGSSLGSGLYFYRVITDSKSDLKKMLLIK